MLKIIKERTSQTIPEYHIEYTYKDDPEAGFWFPALKNGEPDLTAMGPEMKANYDRCQTDSRLNDPEFKVYKHFYTEPAVGKCICGREVILETGYEGAVQCECGRWYNLFGQELRDPKYWEEDYDD